jgi:hypothetical protein
MPAGPESVRGTEHCVNGARLAADCLLGLALGSIVLALDRSDGNTAVPLLIGVGVFLLLQRSIRTSRRFPGTELERGLERLFALLFPRREATTTATARVVMRREIRLARLRRGARRWRNELESITSDGYENASRMSALCDSTGPQDGPVLLAEAVRELRAERASAGSDLTLVNDPVAVLAYGLGARPAGADLRSLEALLDDLGLAGDGDELRSHFDEVVAAETDRIGPQMKTQEERSMFRDLAGASFLLGVAGRIVELALPSALIAEKA